VADVQWFFPRDLSELPPLLDQEGVVPHGGGTGILLGGTSRYRGFIDVGRLGLDGIQRSDTEVTVGAAVSFAAAAAASAGWDPNHVLARSLGAAATTPLRNRITLGGSIALFPYWSDLMGPLLALEAEIRLVGGGVPGASAPGSAAVGGATGRWLPLSDYVQRRELRQSSLIVEVRWQERGWAGEHRRWGRTHTDRPAFTVTVLATRQAEGPTPPQARAVLVGCRGRYRRLASVEEAVVAGKDPAAAAALAEIEIPARMGFSADYLAHCARVELERALAAVTRNGPTDGRQGRRK
jgi:CO/xanthine dehydrogenase FAD-binding subunit